MGEVVAFWMVMLLRLEKTEGGTAANTSKCPAEEVYLHYIITHSTIAYTFHSSLAHLRGLTGAQPHRDDD